ncbi:MAG: AAA family ATPase, partial [Planctomycetota bacterium]|nr:AAA family ATPase [Planctomycetota bacterium]
QDFSIPNPMDGELLFNLDRHRYTKSRLLAALDRGTIKLPHKRRRFKQYESLSLELEEAQCKARVLMRQAPKQLRQMEKSLIDRCVSGYLEDLRAEYPTEAAKQYFDSYALGILQNLEFFSGEDEEELSIPYHFQVNLLVEAQQLADSTQQARESHGSLKSLFGSIDAERPAGDAPEFLKVRAGSLLECDGGVIILDARQLNTDSAAWKKLRHCLLEGRLSLPLTLSTVHCALSCKIVIVGSEDDFHELVECEELQDVFKIKIEMETSVVASDKSVRTLAASYRDLALRSGHRPLSYLALERMLEHAAR